MKKYSSYILPLVLIIGFIGYKLIPTIGVEQVSTEQLANMMTNASDDVFYVDVREPHEFQEAHIEGMTNVPLSELESNFHLIPADKTVVIICRSGNRSLQALNKLEDFGYQNLVNVKGGMLAWEGEVTN
ncbi:rhodanese [Alkalihalobacillus alcalophilus ATCC 27647 = CGMCC 1.3604]|uniref:Rhodanese n=1 Tax=Alkalihalobacillus alcalophilus ATCC 27647 = CGMCC 1.3604 TaxID=1218173 RepID=A0A094XD41_ALKAL|nr:rhodanese-like domain-containing protein [Alkalihalobacillus alcalophilus]KGA96700.1 rhodanese [Alkalihalobacillus alcalophilus ATCC 27647 = CGMCC 1.3604]